MKAIGNFINSLKKLLLKTAIFIAENPPFLYKPKPPWWEFEGWEIIYRTNEGNHATPHFLVESNNKENSFKIRIDDGFIFKTSGNIPSKVKKYVLSVTAENKEELYGYWSEKVNSAIPLDTYFKNQLVNKRK